MANKLDNDIREILRKLRNTEFIVTGSLALQLCGKLDREVGDLDIISTDQRVIDKLKEVCLDLSETITDPNHMRFLYEGKETLFIDVFIYECSNIVLTKYLGKDIVITKPEFVLKTKLLKFKKDAKTILDIIYYLDSNMCNN